MTDLRTHATCGELGCMNDFLCMIGLRFGLLCGRVGHRCLPVDRVSTPRLHRTCPAA